MKFEQFVTSLNERYSVEEIDSVKVVRVNVPRVIIVEGVEVEIPNDSVYVFVDGLLVSSVEPEWAGPNDIVRSLHDQDFFAVVEGRLTRKKI